MMKLIAVASAASAIIPEVRPGRRLRSHGRFDAAGQQGSGDIRLRPRTAQAIETSPMTKLAASLSAGLFR